MADPKEREQLLRDLFDGAGLDYAVDHNDRGLPYVRLGFETRSGAPVVLTAIVQTKVLRITAHGVADAGSHDLWTLNERNQDWGFGRLYQSRETGGVDASCGIYLGGKQPAADYLLYTVEHMADVKDDLAAGKSPHFEIHGGVGVGPTHVAAALQQLGIQFAERQGGELLAARFEGGDGSVPYVVELFTMHHTEVVCRARPLTTATVPLDDTVIGVVNRFNEDLSFGAVHLHRDARLAVWSGRIQAVWTGFDSAALDWLIGKGQYVLDALAKELPHG